MATPLQIDPTRTVSIRRAFIAETNKKFRELRGIVREAIVNKDVFGLSSNPDPLKINIEIDLPRKAYEFQSDSAKVKSFQNWFQQQVDDRLLQVDGDGKPWTNAYVTSSYRKGLLRAYIDTRESELSEIIPEFENITRSQFLNQSFNAPELVSKLELLHTRAFEQMSAVSPAMKGQMNRILADGIANGFGARKIAKNLNDSISKINKTRARTIARTEVIHAHAEGQLDSMERLGVKEVGAIVEWQTAGDDRVCPKCSALDGVVLKIKEARGILPRHPNCRCAWVPAPLSEDSQKRSKTSIQKAIKRSIKEEGPKTINRPFSEIKARSTWFGKTVKIDKKRNQK